MDQDTASLSLLIRPTEQTFIIDGLECRVWIGRTNSGAVVSALVHRVMIDGRQTAELDAATLIPKPPPPGIIPDLMAYEQKEAEKVQPSIHRPLCTEPGVVQAVRVPIRHLHATLP